VDSQAATPPKIVSLSHREDLEALLADIRSLRAQVDVVVLCMHWSVHLAPRMIGDYCIEIAHAAIDAGVDLVLGSHPHILKGIEVYKGKVIFYAMGNFALELGKGDHKDVAFFEALYKIGPQERHDSKKAVLAKVILEDKQISRVSYLPVCANDDSEPLIYKKADPMGQEIFNYVEDISKSEHLVANFEWDGDEVVIRP
jgi:poly-gamma-glutamate synthesis protein (capsule biosynthesis protein)